MFSFRSLLILCLILAVGCSETRQENSVKGSLQWIQHDVEDLGAISLNEIEIDRTLEFFNNGESVVVISGIRSSCSCTTPGVELPLTVQPQETLLLPVHLVIPSGQRRFRQSVSLEDAGGGEISIGKFALDRSAPLEASSYRLDPWILDGEFETTFTLSSHDLTLLSRLDLTITKSSRGAFLNTRDAGFASLSDGRFIRIIVVEGEVSEDFDGGRSQITVSGSEGKSRFSIEIIPTLNPSVTYGK